MDSVEDGGKENSHREIAPLKNAEEMTGEGTPCERKGFWFRGREFVDVHMFLKRFQRELIMDGLEQRRQWLTVMNLSPCWSGPEFSFPETEIGLEILE